MLSRLWKGYRKVAGSAPEITNARSEILRRMNSVCNFLPRGLRKLILRVGGNWIFCWIRASCWLVGNWRWKSKKGFYLYFCNFSENAKEEICWREGGGWGQVKTLCFGLELSVKVRGWWLIWGRLKDNFTRVSVIFQKIWEKRYVKGEMLSLALEFSVKLVEVLGNWHNEDLKDT